MKDNNKRSISLIDSARQILSDEKFEKLKEGIEADEKAIILMVGNSIIIRRRKYAQQFGNESTAQRMGGGDIVLTGGAMGSKDVIDAEEIITALNDKIADLEHDKYVRDQIDQWPLWKILGVDSCKVVEGSILDRYIKAHKMIEDADVVFGKILAEATKENGGTVVELSSIIKHIELMVRKATKK